MTIPSFPDNLYKLVILLGVSIIVIGEIRLENTKTEYETKFNAYITTEFSDEHNVHYEYPLKDKEYELKRQMALNEKESKRLSDLKKAQETELNKISNEKILVVDDKSSKYAQKTLANIKTLTKNYDDNVTALIDSNKQWINYSTELIGIREQIAVLEIKKTNINAINLFRKEDKIKATEEYQQATRFSVLSLWSGFIIIVIGIIPLIKNQSIQDELVSRQLGEKEKYFEFCQSCGKRFDSILKLGLEKDGKDNKSFCIECYDEGTFKDPDLTYEKLKQKTLAGFSGIGNLGTRWVLKYRLKRLDRWRKNRYFKT
jgi:Putative zinc ribbon domain